MLRKILSIIAGYLVFAVTSFGFFKLAGQDPHGDASNAFVAVTIILGVIFSLASGIIVQLISGVNNFSVNYILAIIIAGFATFSLFKSEGSHWTQILAIFIFAPASILGGYFLKKLVKKKENIHHEG